MYAIEDGVTNQVPNLPGTYNRQMTEGDYGIWGHALEDLIYNGSAQIATFDQQSIVCDLGCDS